MNTLIADIISNIFCFLKPSKYELPECAFISKTWLQGYKQYRKLEQLELFPEQLKIIEDMLVSKKHFQVLHLPVGWGKTYTVLGYLLRLWENPESRKKYFPVLWQSPPGIDLQTYKEFLFYFERKQSKTANPKIILHKANMKEKDDIDCDILIISKRVLQAGKRPYIREIKWKLGIYDEKFEKVYKKFFFRNYYHLNNNNNNNDAKEKEKESKIISDPLWNYEKLITLDASWEAGRKMRLTKEMKEFIEIYDVASHKKETENFLNDNEIIIKYCVKKADSYIDACAKDSANFILKKIINEEKKKFIVFETTSLNVSEIFNKKHKILNPRKDLKKSARLSDKLQIGIDMFSKDATYNGLIIPTSIAGKGYNIQCADVIVATTNSDLTQIFGRIRRRGKAKGPIICYIFDTKPMVYDSKYDFLHSETDSQPSDVLMNTRLCIANNGLINSFPKIKVELNLFKNTEDDSFKYKTVNYEVVRKESLRIRDKKVYHWIAKSAVRLSLISESKSKILA